MNVLNAVVAAFLLVFVTLALTYGLFPAMVFLIVWLIRFSPGGRK